MAIKQQKDSLSALSSGLNGFNHKSFALCWKSVVICMHIKHKFLLTTYIQTPAGTSWI